MSEQTQRGNFIVGQNRGKTQGSRELDFTGRLSIPGREGDHAVALWLRKDKNDRPYFSGRMDPLPLTDDVAAQIAHLAQPGGTGEVLEAGPNLSLDPYQVILFANRFKEPDPADTPEQGEQRAKRPDYWGRFNPGDSTPVVGISVWLTQDRYQRPLLAGSTTYPQPGKRIEAETTERPPEEVTFEEASGGSGRKGKRDRDDRA
ncbi:MAG: hypothetical protein HC869_09555 [Rhodospirillales bacterium]|nr:hypothetical protein [Rhodospirillales bacterium]